MLILTRKVGQTIMIGGDVSVTVLGVNGNQVRVGGERTEGRRCPSGRSLRTDKTRAAPGAGLMRIGGQVGRSPDGRSC